MNIPSYDQWKLANGHEDEKPCYDCDHCDGAINYGEKYHEFGFCERVHPECVEEYAKDNLSTLRTAGE